MYYQKYISTDVMSSFKIILWFAILCKLYYSCTDNCIAYRVTMTYLPLYDGFNLFYLPSMYDNCKQCYFGVSAYNSKGNYNFILGVYQGNGTFLRASKNYLSATSGFTTCQPGFCAISFQGRFSTFVIQTIKGKQTNSCFFNTSNCGGSADLAVNFQSIEIKEIDLECSIV